jgi:hypothetical protein
MAEGVARARCLSAGEAAAAEVAERERAQAERVEESNMSKWRLLEVGLAAMLLASCERSLDIRILNGSRFTIDVQSEEKVGTAAPGAAITVPFPSRSSGSQLSIAANEEMRCYRLGFDLDRHGKRRVSQHHILQAFVDGELRLHLPAAQQNAPDEVVPGYRCLPTR